MLKKVTRFFKEYRQFGLVLLSLIVGLVLELTKQHKWAHLVLGASAAINTIPLVWGMIEDVRSGKYGIDILAATAIITSVVLGEYWAGMIIVVMLTGGEALEDYAEKRAKTELTDLLSRKPKKAHLLKGRKTIDINVKDVAVGSKLLIYPGELVPVDCVIVEGNTSFDESSLTGESLPVAKGVGDQAMSGSVNVEGAITVKALHSAEDSQYQQIIKLVQSAGSGQSPFVRLADRYSIPFTIAAFAIAGTTWFVSGHAIRFLEVIVVATPCPLLLGAPIALISGMSRSAKRGIIVKTGSSLERLAEVETVAFDKTGTLTKGIPVVDAVQTFHGFDKKEVLAHAAALEQGSVHILAKAIVDEATIAKIKITKAKHITEIAGQGLSARLGNKAVMVGRLSLLKKEGIELPKNWQEKSVKTTATFVAIDAKLAGIISFTDQVRPEAKSMLDRLRRVGIRHTLMVTGDNQTTAEAVAKELSITEVLAECLPVDKIHAVQNVKHKPVAFVGDGVNDAPVLTAADVGIALGARGSTAASESADVVIMLDDVSKVADSVEIAKRTFFIAKQSILMGIFISLGLMGVFATGKFRPVYGAALQEVVDVAVIFNALRAHTSGKQRKV